MRDFKTTIVKICKNYIYVYVYCYDSTFFQKTEYDILPVVAEEKTNK